MSYIVEEAKSIPNSYVKEKLRELIDSGNSSQTIQRVFDYLNVIAKCDSESAMKAMEELKDLVKKDDIRTVLVNVCPTTADEVRSVLAMDTGSNYSPEDVDNIVKIISKYVKS
ncbi:MAG: RNA polymerase Rpb4 family protein [Thermoprotei archaeon]